MSCRIYKFERRTAAAESTVIGAPLAGTTLDDELPEPHTIVVDRSLSVAQLESGTLAARRFYALLSTGHAKYAQRALADEFVDHCLPVGGVQGPAGVCLSARTFSAAVPDLRVVIEEMTVVGDRVISRLRFTGHYTGEVMGRQGDGRRIDFMTIDICRVVDGRVVENWHVEDNPPFPSRLDVMAH